LTHGGYCRINGVVDIILGVAMVDSFLPDWRKALVQLCQPG